MSSLTVTAVLGAPKEEVFDYLSQVANLPKWASEFARELKYEDGMTRDTTAELVVDLAAGDWIAYDVNVGHATYLAVSVAITRSPEQAFDATPIAVSIDDEPIRVEAYGASVRGTSGQPVDAGRHVLRVECLARQATIRSIDLDTLHCEKPGKSGSLG